MAPKRQSAAPTPSSISSTSSLAPPPPSTLPSSKAVSSAHARTLNSSSSDNPSLQAVLEQAWNSYLKSTPQRIKLLDAFMGFLVFVGMVQFVYVVLAGNYPFNAFLSGFSAAVGQFVLTASLRIQMNPENKTEFKGMSEERAFADFVLGSLILHFFCVNFIN